MDYRDLTEQERSWLRDQLRDLARAFARPAGSQEDRAGGREEMLARLRVLGIMQAELEQAAAAEALSASEDGANFRELGDAWGITRQAARKRWPRPRTESVPRMASAPRTASAPLPRAPAEPGPGAAHDEQGRRRPAASWTRHQSRPGRAVLVAESLDSLHGPVDGVVELPLWLFWSGRDRAFDLSKPFMLRSMYEAVLGEAASPGDLTGWLDRDTLVRVWPDLYLPKGVRRAWEERHPVLRASAHAA